ncbi:MAG: phosphodiesterase [Clostridia bacterium]|nr:phosphodiesterase [Clostridia bacterium]
MKWLIASDLHGSALTCRALLEAFDRERADRLLFLGDLLYHGPRNNLPDGYEPKEVIGMLNDRKDSLFCVRGNCDTEVDQMVLEFPIMAPYALIPLGERMIFATHGHHFHQGAMPPLKAGDILLHGHTHVPTWDAVGERYIFNPGSVTIPKGGSVRGYMTLEEGAFLWKSLEGELLHSLTL